MTEFETDYLAHHGIKGQKWGVRRTPEELGHVSPGKKKKNSAKSVYENLKKRHEDRKDLSKAKNRARLKEYIRDHPKSITKFRKILTEQEANEIISKINFDRKLEDVRDSEIQRGRDRFKSRVEHTKNISSLAVNSKQIYNTSASVVDALIEAGVIDPGSLGKLTKDGKTIRLK